jgi:hypothetical protein
MREQRPGERCHEAAVAGCHPRLPPIVDCDLDGSDLKPIRIALDAVGSAQRDRPLADEGQR